MKKTLLLILFSSLLLSQDTDFKIMPTVSSNPTSGTGVGVMSSLVYQVDDSSSPSQAIGVAQYTTTDSYNIFLFNNMFMKNDDYHILSGGGYIYNNASLDLPVSIPEFLSDDAEMDVNVFVVFTQVYYKLHEHFYAGAQVFYIDQRIKATNTEGRVFLTAFGIEDNKRLGIGPVLSYDTRSKSEKFFPRDAYFVSYAFNYFGKLFGSDSSYFNTNLNARSYKRGFRSQDVIATQLYSKYCSEDTPDGALATLGANNILRGFPLGQYKARFLTAVQAEYRYELDGTKFKLTAFGGGANLSLGSKGTPLGNRETNNGNYYSGGAGIHYALQEKVGIDYRIDLVYSSDKEVSVYATINQAF